MINTLKERKVVLVPPFSSDLVDLLLEIHTSDAHSLCAQLIPCNISVC